MLTERQLQMLGPSLTLKEMTPREYASAVMDGTVKLELVHERHTVEPKICELCGKNFMRSADVPMKERVRECGACPPRKTKFD